MGSSPPIQVHMPVSVILPAMVIGSTVVLASCAAQVRVAGPAVYSRRPIVGWIWTPGYWACGMGGYYWVPGTWVAPPRIGVLWTPGYWALVGGSYVWHVGYWGPHVGFYGGVNYGFGYTGVGFVGGRWVGRSFTYNRSVTNVTSIHVTNIYNETVINNVNVTRVSYNGGADGTRAAPNAVERMAQREALIQPTPMQRRHIEEAEHNPALSAKANRGRPPIAATARPAAFNAAGVMRARGASPAVEDAALRRGERNGRPNAARKHRRKPRENRKQEK